jgi:N6-L-threonylcarbamoyladenine synthase
MNILAVESSCDETSAAVLSDRRVISLVTATQAVHEQYGGVVPELASRAHQSNIVPVMDECLKQSGLSLSEMDVLAVTEGPGLMGSLHVGVSFMKSLSMTQGIPLLGINHMKGHVLAHCIEGQYEKEISFPFLCLTVSGGHTQVVQVLSPTEMNVIASTKDDAAGEAIDKGAKLLGLPYPGGPVMDRLSSMGDSNRFTFSTAKMEDHHFSFSGLKTSLLYFLQKQKLSHPTFVEDHLNDLCASYQRAVVDYLIAVFLKNWKDYPYSCIALAGGVSANSYLRKRWKALEAELKVSAFIPHFQYCTDNAAMIGITAYYEFLSGYQQKMIVPQPRLTF